jgi:hypothetical protein
MQLPLPGLTLSPKPQTTVSHGRAPKEGVPDHLRELYRPLPARRCTCSRPLPWRDDDGTARCGLCGRERLCS